MRKKPAVNISHILKGATFLCVVHKNLILSLAQNVKYEGMAKVHWSQIMKRVSVIP